MTPEARRYFGREPEGSCQRFPAFVKKLPTAVCGEHPAFAHVRHGAVTIRGDEIVGSNAVRVVLPADVALALKLNPTTAAKVLDLPPAPAANAAQDAALADTDNLSPREEALRLGREGGGKAGRRR